MVKPVGDELGVRESLHGTQGAQLDAAPWNAAAVTFPSSATIHQQVVEQVARTPNEVALIFRDRSLTYSSLNAQSDMLASRLRAEGVTPGTVVGISVPRSLELVVGLLAILKAGGAYVPLDPSYPSERLHWMLEDSGASVIVISDDTATLFPALDSRRHRVVRVDDAAHATSPSATSSVAALSASSNDLAYLLYTSGSTGKPKGVEVTHRNVVNFFTGMDAVIGGAPGVWLAVTSVGFDISVLEIFWTLTRGFRVIVQEEGQLASATASLYSLPQQMKRHAVTHLQCTPSLAAMLVRDAASVAALRTLRRLLVGGEALAPDLARKLLAATDGRVLNMYGPTETTIWSVTHTLSPDEERVLIGRPIANTQVYVLDAEGRPVPIGEEGELYIGGEGVARGYHSRPELTAERFVADPFSHDLRGRLYRTGDIVRLDREGLLEFVGRVDQQVKIRGVRIELAEIEATLRAHPAVAGAVVAVRGTGVDDKRLVGYVVPVNGRVAERELHDWLSAKLPSAMVPSALVWLDAIPTLPNGKTDRGALPEPTESGRPGLGSAPPATRLEREIAAIWADTLGLESVGTTDRFFDLGGHSLLMVEVHGRLQEVLGRQLSLVDLFRYPTIRALAAFIESPSNDETPAGSAARGQRRQESIARRQAPRRPATTEDH